LSVGPILPTALRKDLFEHVFMSQIEISKIYGRGNVFPIAALMKDGVRHAYFYRKRIRATLPKALQPLRWLSNEILMSPSPIYSDIALSEICRMNLLADNDEINIALLMCLTLPLASQIPGEVLCILEDILSANKSGFINSLVKESKEILIKDFLA